MIPIIESLGIDRQPGVECGVPVVVDVVVGGSLERLEPDIGREDVGHIGIFVDALVGEVQVVSLGELPHPFF